VTSTNCSVLSGNLISPYSALRQAAAEVSGAHIRRSPLPPPGSGAAGMSVPSRRANLARSACPIHRHAQSVAASTGTPARKTGIRAIPVTSPASTTVKVTSPTPNPAIRWTKASQVRAEKSAPSTDTGPPRRLSVATGAPLPATS
jgi:hypothetical protein